MKMPNAKQTCTNPQWFVLHTKPRNEVKACERLRQQGIEAYAPTYLEVRQYSDRKKKVRVPFFASYVFVRLSEKDRPRAFCHPGILRYLYWQGKPAVVRETELDLIRTYLEGRERHQVLVERLAVGDQVVLVRGALKGQQAHIETLSTSRVRLVLPVLGYKITTRPGDVAPVREAS
jgi:transcription antitermination factor NusG